MNKKQKAECEKLCDKLYGNSRGPLRRLGFSDGYQAALESEAVKTKKLVEALRESANQGRDWGYGPYESDFTKIARDTLAECGEG